MFKRLCVVVCLVVIPLVSKAVVTVENGSYQNVQITFAPNVAVDNAEEIIESLKDLLQNTSNTLQSAVGLHIKSVVFRLPAAWDVSAWENITVEAASKGASSSDIWVDATQQNAFGVNPFAVQYGGCGVPGEEITIPVEFLSSQGDYPKGKLLAREWLKYRYGVFDENGFHEDMMYPAYYQIPGTTDVHITECTNTAVKYDYKDTNGTTCSLEIPFASEDCQILVDEENSENVTSSLLYLHHGLRNMEHVCGKNHSHNADAPNKQNTLCAGQSIWDILMRSSDFQNLPNDVPNSADEIQFTFVQETKPRVVMAWENSDNLHDEGNLVLFGVRRLLYDLPVASKLALYSFNNEEKEVPPLQEVTPDRQGVISSSFVADFDVNVSSVVEKIVEALVSDNADTEGSLILITGSESPGDVSEDLRQKLKDSQLCVTIVVFVNGVEAAAESYKTLFTDLSCGYLVPIPRPIDDEGKAAAFEILYQAMRMSWQQTPAETKTSTVTTGIISSRNPVVIPHDPSVEKFTLWLDGDGESGNVICTSGERSVLLARIPTLQGISEYSFDADEGEVTCVLKFLKLSPALTHVQSTTKPGKYFDESVWVHDTTEKGTDDQMPVIIYARINRGSYPIQNAVVTANVTGPDGQVLESFPLFDNGKGDPDITQNDGIYSRYYTHLEKEGEYSVLITFESDGNLTSIGKNGSEQCCGSKVRSEAIEEQTFKRTFQTKFHAKAKNSETVYKPSRVIDFRVDSFDPQNRVLLKWTAPGGEYDRGKATGYQFYIFCDAKYCNDEGSLPDWILRNGSSSMPGSLGHQEETQFLFSVDAPQNATVFFGVRSLNHNNVTSDLSNLAPVFFGIVISPTEQPPVVTSEWTQSQNAQLIVAAVLAALLFLLGIAAAIYVIRRKAAEASKDKKNIVSESGAVDISSQFQSFRFGNSMRRVESFPIQLYTHDQIKDLKATSQLYRSGTQPKPWLSLDDLPPKRDKYIEGGSDQSASTLRVSDSKPDGKEIQQLDNVSLGSEPHLDKVAGF